MSELAVFFHPTIKAYILTITYYCMNRLHLKNFPTEKRLSTLKETPYLLHISCAL